MFKVKKNNVEFIFLETNDNVVVYKNKENIVTKVADFGLPGLALSIEGLKKLDHDLVASKNTWILNARVDNIEKVPLNKEEMFKYAKWKIQEVLDVALHDVYYDILTNNSLDGNFYKKYATAIIAKKSHIDSIISAFFNAKVNLFSIDSRATSILDFFAKNKILVEKKSLTFLKIEEEKATMYVYYDGGLVFDRSIDLPKLKKHGNEIASLSEDDYRSTVDKLCLEIQRNVDFLDRQYGIQHFESIVYSVPDGEMFNSLTKEVSDYFNVKSLDLMPYFLAKPKDNELIPVTVLASFGQDYSREESINLIPKVEKVASFSSDFKKIFMGSVLLGLAVSIAGAIYESRAKVLKEEVTVLKDESEKLGKEVSDIKSKVIVINVELEKDISNLIKNKDNIIRLQSQKTLIHENLYQKIMKDIAIQATNSKVVLTRIKYNENGLLLVGSAQTKDIFSDFINNLPKAESLKGKSLSLISVEQKDNGFIFEVSSENMGNKQ